MNVAQKRENWIDFVKGIAILLVIAGHSGISSIITFPIYYFHMPLFFIISGYLFNCKKGAKEFIIGKLRSLIYPYFVFGILVAIWNTGFSLFAGEDFKIIQVVKRLVALLYGNYIFEDNIHYIGTLWFLVTLFSTEVLFYFISGSKLKYVYISCLGIVGVGLSVLNLFFRIRLPWGIDIACVAIVFFAGGVIFKTISDRLQKFSYGLILTIIGFIIGITNTYLMHLLGLKSIRVDMLSMNYGIIVLYLFSALMISFGILILAKRLYTKVRCVFIEHLGQLSLVIMVLHLYIKQVLGIFLSNSIVVFILTVILTILISLFIEKYLPFLYKFGFKKRGTAL